MTCRDMDDVISSHAGDSVLAPQSAAHLVHCARCRSLTRLLDEAAARDGLDPSESQLLRIQTNIAAGLKPVRPLPLSRIFLFACAIIFLLVAAAGALTLAGILAPLLLGSAAVAFAGVEALAGMFFNLGFGVRAVRLQSGGAR